MFRYNTHSALISSGDITSLQTGDGDILQISRVQDCTIGFETPTDTITFLDTNIELVRLQVPTVNVTLEYLTTNGMNERNIGFVTNGTSGAFIKLDQERNFYFVAQQDRQDAAGGSLEARNVLAVGNALLQGYTFSAAVGDFARSTLNYSALNICVNEGSTGLNPALSYTDGSVLPGTYALPIITSQVTVNSPNPADDVTAIHSKDILLTFSSGAGMGVNLSGYYGCQLQNFNLSVSLERESAISMGQKYPASRSIVYPITIELQAEAHIDRFTKECLRQYFCDVEQHSVTITLKQPCSELVAFEIGLNNLRLANQSFVATIGEIDVVNFTWQGVIRSAFDTGANLFITSYEGTELWIQESCFPVTGVDINGDFYFTSGCFYSKSFVENIFQYGT